MFVYGVRVGYEQDDVCRLECVFTTYNLAQEYIEKCIENIAEFYTKEDGCDQYFTIDWKKIVLNNYDTASINFEDYPEVIYIDVIEVKERL